MMQGGVEGAALAGAVGGGQAHLAARLSCLSVTRDGQEERTWQCELKRDNLLSGTRTKPCMNIGQGGEKGARVRMGGTRI